MKKVIVVCPKCKSAQSYKNWFIWVLSTPFHWFGKRYTKCKCCGKYSFMKREKIAKWLSAYCPICGRKNDGR